MNNTGQYEYDPQGSLWLVGIALRYQVAPSLKNPDKPRQLTGDDIDIKPNQEPLVSVYADSEQTSTVAVIAYKKPAEKQGSFRQSQNQRIFERSVSSKALLRQRTTHISVPKIL